MFFCFEKSPPRRNSELPFYRKPLRVSSYVGTMWESPKTRVILGTYNREFKIWTQDSVFHQQIVWILGFFEQIWKDWPIKLGKSESGPRTNEIPTNTYGLYEFDHWGSHLGISSIFSNKARVGRLRKIKTSWLRVVGIGLLFGLEVGSGFGSDIGISFIAKFIPFFYLPLCIILVNLIESLAYSLETSYVA